MLDLKQDGITHLNIYSKAKTNIGKQLTNMYLFNIEFNGKTFSSVEHVWHYLKFVNTNPDIAEKLLQISNPFEILQFARANKTAESTAVALSQDFKNIIKNVLRQRIILDPKLMLLIRNSWLPFEHYYVYGDTKVHDQRDKYEWLINTFEEIRTELHFEYLDDLLDKYGHLCYNMQTAPSNACYAGRPKSGQVSIYGNPFPIDTVFKKLKGTEQHYLFDQAVAKSVIEFRHYLFNDIQKAPKSWYADLTKIKQKPLKCFCTNGTNSRLKGANFCHTLILAQFADNVDDIYKYLGIKLDY